MTFLIMIGLTLGLVVYACFWAWIITAIEERINRGKR